MTSDGAKKAIQDFKQSAALIVASGSCASAAPLPVQEGDPSLPAVYTKEATFTAAKPPITITSRKRRFVTNPEEGYKASVFKAGVKNGDDVASSSSLCPMSDKAPVQVAHLSTLDDPDFSMSEDDL